MPASDTRNLWPILLRHCSMRESQLHAVAGYLTEAANRHGRMVFVAGST